MKLPTLAFTSALVGDVLTLIPSRVHTVSCEGTAAVSAYHLACQQIGFLCSTAGRSLTAALDDTADLEEYIVLDNPGHTALDAYHLAVGLALVVIACAHGRFCGGSVEDRVYLTTQAVSPFTLRQIDFIAVASHYLSAVVACHDYDVFLLQLFHRFHNGTATDVTVTYNAVVTRKAFACNRVSALEEI